MTNKTLKKRTGEWRNSLPLGVNGSVNDQEIMLTLLCVTLLSGEGNILKFNWGALQSHLERTTLRPR